MVQPGETTNDVTTWCIRVACWISKATRTRMHTPTSPGIRTHAHAGICNSYCFSSATMIRERVSILRYTYIACLVVVVVADVRMLAKRERYLAFTTNRTTNPQSHSQ